MNADKIAFKNMTLGLTALAGITLAAGTAFADDPTTMAPPIDGASAPLSAGNAGVNASADSVFNWQEIPASQQVPLTRATFDQGGYQLYDTAGETIVVPFTNQNLYVMKFAESPNGNLFFENEGGFPVLYVPKGGFLENATVAGARWYPLGQDFHPVEPVFLGIAPSYTDFVDLGWYSDTRFYGGYYGQTSFLEGGLFLPTIGLFFEIGDRPYYGWNSYRNYYIGHPGYYHTAFYNRDFYHYAGNHYRTFAPDRHFSGYAGGGNYGAGGYNRGFGGGSHTYTARSGFGGQGGGNVRTFRGAGGFGQGGHGYTVSRSSVTVNNYGGGHSYGGGQSGSGRTFRGASNSGGGQSYSGRSYSGGQPYSGGHSYGGNGGDNGRIFGGGQSSGGARSFGGNSGGSRSYGGGAGGRSFGGGQSSGGGQHDRAASNSGGGHSAGGRNQGGGSKGDGGGRSR